MWRFVLLFAIMLTLLIATLRYLERQWTQAPSLSESTRRRIRWSLRAVWLCIWLGIPARFSGLSGDAVVALFWVSYLSFGFYALALFATIGLDVFERVVKKVSGTAPEQVSGTAPEQASGTAPSGTTPNQASGTAPEPSRRAFLSRGVALPAASLAGLGSAYGVTQTRRPKLVEVEVTLDHLPPAFDGYKIVQISDLHIGLTIRKGFAQAVVDLSLAQSPDLIALTGDLMDGGVAELSADMAPLAELSAPDGVFYCTGNHEYYSGALDWIDHFRGFGWHCLLNEHRVVKRGESQIAVCGVTDRSAHQIIPEHRSDPARALKGLTTETFKLMLAHQPKSIHSFPPREVDLTLSGHTHGGQFFPWSLLVRVAQPYLKGLYRHDERAQLYVNQGTGYWGPPLRIFTECEVTLITLRSGG